MTKLLRRIRQGVKVALGAVFAGVVLWCIVYRAFLGFTPPWLDEVTIGITIMILLVAGVLKLRDGRASPHQDVVAPASVDSSERL